MKIDKIRIRVTSGKEHIVTVSGDVDSMKDINKMLSTIKKVLEKELKE